jgi:hypothetical protein
MSKPDSNWIETHHEVVLLLDNITGDIENYPRLQDAWKHQGTGGMWELGEKITTEFCELHEDREWDGDWYDTLEDFVKTKCK